MPPLALCCPETSQELLCPGLKAAERGLEVASVTTGVFTSRLSRAGENSWDFASLGAGSDKRGRWAALCFAVSKWYLPLAFVLRKLKTPIITATGKRVQRGSPTTAFRNWILLKCVTLSPGQFWIAHMMMFKKQMIPSYVIVETVKTRTMGTTCAHETFSVSWSFKFFKQAFLCLLDIFSSIHF